jgi:hypothetical protein
MYRLRLDVSVIVDVPSATTTLVHPSTILQIHLSFNVKALKDVLIVKAR